MRKNHPSDSLLAFARLLIGVLMGFIALAAIGIVIALGVVLTGTRVNILADSPAAGLADSYPAVVAILILMILLFALGIIFMRELYRIVGSVEQGDPFQPFNADRLRRMGWIIVVGQLVLFVIAGVSASGSRVRPDFDGDALLSGLGAMLMALILFILARVFRVGADMRGELDGTV